MPSSIVAVRLAAKANPANVRSRAHQREASTTAPLSRGHVARVRVHQNSKDRAAAPSKSCLTTSCELGAGFGQRPFHQHSHWSRLSLLTATDRPVLTSLGAGQHSPAARHSAERGAFIQMRVSDCTPARVNTLAHEQTVDPVAHVLHLNRLSKSRSSAGFKTSQKGLQGRGKVIQADRFSIQRGRCD